MKLLSILSANDGRALKRIIQGLIKSGACERALVSNYIHAYRNGEGKKITKTQHKLLQIYYEDTDKLTTMLDKLMSGRREDYWVCEMTDI